MQCLVSIIFYYIEFVNMLPQLISTINEILLSAFYATPMYLLIRIIIYFTYLIKWELFEKAHTLYLFYIIIFGDPSFFFFCSSKGYTLVYPDLFQDNPSHGTKLWKIQLIYCPNFFSYLVMWLVYSPILYF